MGLVCDFITPVLITDEQPLSVVVAGLYEQLIVPISIDAENVLMDSMKKQFPKIPFTKMLVLVQYDEPFKA